MGDVDAGIVAVAGKVNPAELCQWLKRKTRKDVKIVCPDPPAENRKQVFLSSIYYGRMKGTVCDVLGSTNECILVPTGKLARGIMCNMCLPDR